MMQRPDPGLPPRGSEDYRRSGVDTPSLKPSGSLNWNILAPQGRSARSSTRGPPAALIRAAAAGGPAARAPRRLDPGGGSVDVRGSSYVELEVEALSLDPIPAQLAVILVEDDTD